MRNEHRNNSEERRERGASPSMRLTRFVMGFFMLVSTVMVAPIVGAGAAGADESAVPADSDATSTSVARSRAGSAPKQLTISSINVKAPIIRLGLRKNGRMEVPSNGRSVGYFTGGPRPGEMGPAVIAGHVNWAGRWAVFQKLSKVKTGDRVSVKRRDGRTLTFLVTRVSYFHKNKFPTNLVYGHINYPGLRVITCSPYGTSNFIVFARQLSTLRINS